MPCEIIVGKRYKVKGLNRRYFTKEIIKILSIKDDYAFTDDKQHKFHINSMIAGSLVPHKQKIG